MNHVPSLWRHSVIHNQSYCLISTESKILINFCLWYVTISVNKLIREHLNFHKIARRLRWIGFFPKLLSFSALCCACLFTLSPLTSGAMHRCTEKSSCGCGSVISLNEGANWSFLFVLCHLSKTSGREVLYTSSDVKSIKLSNFCKRILSPSSIPPTFPPKRAIDERRESEPSERFSNLSSEVNN